MDEAEKARQLERKIQLEETNQKVLAKGGRFKRYRDRTKLYRPNKTFQNNERKFSQQVRGEWAKTYQQLDAKNKKRFWSKIWERKDHNEKADGLWNRNKRVRTPVTLCHSTFGRIPLGKAMNPLILPAMG